MTKEQLEKIQTKFISDPDWVLVEEMIREYIDPLSNVATIDSNQSNDAIASEVRGRQIASEQLIKFLKDCRVLKKITNNNSTNFK